MRGQGGRGGQNGHMGHMGHMGQMGQMGSQLFSGKDNGAFDFSWCAYIIFNKV